MGDSVITGDRSLEAFNPELEARKVRTILLSVKGNSGIFSDQILFETLFMGGLEDILNVGLKLVWKLSLSRDCISYFKSWASLKMH